MVLRLEGFGIEGRGRRVLGRRDVFGAEERKLVNIICIQKLKKDLYMALDFLKFCQSFLSLQKFISLFQFSLSSIGQRDFGGGVPNSSFGKESITLLE